MEDDVMNNEERRMGLVQALIVLHRLRDISTNAYVIEALGVVFQWIDDINLYLKVSLLESIDDSDKGRRQG